LAVIDILRPVVDASILRLSNKKFTVDPLMGEELSRTTSVVSSVYKRHGQILERAILEALNQHDRFTVWNNRALSIPLAAEALAGQYIGNHAAALNANIGHGGPSDRAVQVDLLVYDHDQNTVKSYEIKRGAGTHDAGKKRSMIRDLLCTQVVLKSYGDEYTGLDCASAQSHIIIYYGAENLGAPFTLFKGDLDDHFGVPVVGDVEEVNDYYKEQIELIVGG